MISSSLTIEDFLEDAREAFDTATEEHPYSPALVDISMNPYVVSITSSIAPLTGIVDLTTPCTIPRPGSAYAYGRSTRNHEANRLQLVSRHAWDALKMLDIRAHETNRADTVYVGLRMLSFPSNL